MPEIGDTKITFKVDAQRRGWFYLDGQTIAGDAIASANATLLYGSATLPDLTGKYTHMADNAGVNQTVGANYINLTQAQLPKVVLPLSYIGTRANQPDGPMAYWFTGANLNWSGGSNYGGLPFEEFGTVLNPNATQAVVDNRPLSVGVRYMVFLDTSS